ncbi:MAG: cytochrome c biogenesis protein CcsA [Syntrophales bacterium]|nr:cytochrome c biogenesis protein CcsA [Syntrophales bacterium]
MITWIVYAAALHLRLSRGWQGKRTAALAILGFISVLFTYLGVNFLPGLHSYLN